MQKAVYFITADDDFVAANRAKEIFEELSKDVVDEFSKEIIEASSQKSEDAISACAAARIAAETISLFGGKKVVWMRGVDFICDSRAGKSEDVKETLANFAEFLRGLNPDYVQVLISASPIDRRKAFFKALNEFAECEDFSSGKDPVGACAKLVAETARRKKMALGNGTAETIASIVAANPRMALQELEKLSVYVNGERPIEVNDAIDMVPIFGEGEFFDITNAFFAGNLNAGLGALRRYFFANKNASARPILTALQKQNSLLIQLRAMMETGDIPKSASPVSQDAMVAASRRYSEYFESSKSSYNVFSQNQWYACNKLAPIAGKISLKKLTDFQLEFARAFLRLIEQGSNSDESVMRDLFARCLTA